jgi:sigma-B regulation protein RsbU (phosphoserine phosphatase)
VADGANPRNLWLAETVRSAAISMAVGVALLFLIFIGRSQFWSVRLALYGAAGGLTAYAFSHFLDTQVGDRIRRRRIAPDRLVSAVLYFIAGCAAVVVTTEVMQAAGVMPFVMSAHDLQISALMSGAVSIVVGLLFYTFHVLRDRLRESVERIKEQEFAEKELEMARAIQIRLLPPQELSGSGYRITARNLAARFVAGDFYDVFHVSDGTLGIVVADVSGKGMGASLIMASVKAVLPFMAEGRDVAATLSALGRKLHGELAAREFVALTLARFDPRSGALHLANAGLPDPYLLRGDGSVETLGVPGPRLPLGARSDVEYESMSITMNQGERILMVTDGLPESLTSAGEPLGYDVLARMVTTAAAGSGDLIDSLFGAVRGASQQGLDDDCTALLLEAVAVSRA